MVVLHASADANGMPWVDVPQSERIAPLLLRSVIYIARTELFIIISLFLLLMSLDRRPRGYGETVLEMARRLMVPFMFWCLFFAVYNLFKASYFGYADAVIADLRNPLSWPGYVLLGSVKYHLHFVPTLYALVLLYPVYRIAVRVPALGLGILALLLVKWTLDQFLYDALAGTPELVWLARGLKILAYVGYGLVAGAFVAIYDRAGDYTLEPLVPLLLFAGAMLFLFKLVGVIHTLRDGEWPFAYAPEFWADFLMPVVVFAIAMALGDRRWPGILSRLAPYSFGIYLCHPAFLDLAEIVLRDTTLAPIFIVLAKAGTALAGSSLLVFLLSRTTLLAWTIGLGPFPWPGRRPAVN